MTQTWVQYPHSELGEFPTRSMFPFNFGRQVRTFDLIFCERLLALTGVLGFDLVHVQLLMK